MQLQAEEGMRALDSELQQCRQRAVQLEAAVWQRDRELSASQRQLDQARGGEVAVLGKQLQVEEASRHLETDVVALRQRVVQLEDTLRVRDREAERLGAQLQAAGSKEAEQARQAEEQARWV
jgi:hypothetical protein